MIKAIVYKSNAGHAKEYADSKGDFVRKYTKIARDEYKERYKNGF